MQYTQGDPVWFAHVRMLCLQTILEIPGKRRQVLEQGDRWSVSSGDTLVFGNARCQVDIGPAAARGDQVLFRATVACSIQEPSSTFLGPLIDGKASMPAIHKSLCSSPYLLEERSRSSCLLLHLLLQRMLNIEE